MNFIRKLHFFIHLIVLFLFVLQRVNADCEKNSETVKNKLNEALLEAMPSTMDGLKTHYLRKNISYVERKLLTVAIEMLEEGMKRSLNGDEQINEENLLKEKMSEMEIDDTYDKQEVIYHIESWFKELKLHLSRDIKRQPEMIFQYKIQKEIFNSLCIKLMQMCVNHTYTFKRVNRKKKGFHIYSDEPITNYAYLYIFPNLKLFSCSYKNEYGKKNKFLFRIAGNFPSNYAILFKDLGTVKKLNPFAVMNITDFMKSI